MFKNILRSKMRFFHINPVGRVLNRFSQDMSTVDGQLITYVAYVSAVRYIKSRHFHLGTNEWHISTGSATFYSIACGNHHLPDTYNYCPYNNIGILCPCKTMLHSKFKVCSCQLTIECKIQIENLIDPFRDWKQQVVHPYSATSHHHSMDYP